MKPDKEIPNYGTLMTVEDFAECVKTGGFIDYDGWGNLAIVDKCSSLTVTPSSFKKGKCFTAIFEHRDQIDIPDWATHVVWYNR